MGNGMLILPATRIDDGAEVLEGLESVRPLHRRFDLAVQPLDDPRRDPAVDELKDALPVTLDRSCRFDHRFQAAVRRPEVPAFQECLGIGPIRVAPQPLERQLDLVRHARPAIHPGHPVQVGLLRDGQLPAVLQPQIPTLLQERHRSNFLPSHQIDRPVEHRHHVVPVERQRGLRKLFRNAQPVRLPHVRAEVADLLPRNVALIKKRPEFS